MKPDAVQVGSGQEKGGRVRAGSGQSGNFFREAGARMKAGILTENPIFVQLLGMCPTLATTTSVKNALGMGVAATAVLVCSNTLISLLRKFIPRQVRIAAYIVIISGFVTAVEMMMKAYFYDLYRSLGLFIPLIVVNCIILARAEAFASRNRVLPSAVDGLATGLGFLFALLLISTIREIVGAGTFFGIPVFGEGYSPAVIFVLPAGAFFTLSLIIAAVQKVRNVIGDRRRHERLSDVGDPSSIPANIEYYSVAEPDMNGTAIVSSDSDENAELPLDFYPPESEYAQSSGDTDKNSADSDTADYPDADWGMPL